MKTVLFGYGFAAVFVVFPLLNNWVLMRALPEARDSQLVGIRRISESRGTEALLAGWLVLCLVGGMFLLIRGRSVGWAWFGVAVVYALALLIARRNRDRVLSRLGDRGRLHTTDRQWSRTVASYRFGALGVTAYVAMRVVEYAYPHHLPTAAEIVRGLFAAMVVVGAIGFVVTQSLLRFGRDKLPTE